MHSDGGLLVELNFQDDFTFKSLALNCNPVQRHGIASSTAVTCGLSFGGSTLVSHPSLQSDEEGKLVMLECNDDFVLEMVQFVSHSVGGTFGLVP